MIDTKDGTNIHTRIDVTATIERVKDDTILALAFSLYENGFFELLRDKHGSLA